MKAKNFHWRSPCCQVLHYQNIRHCFKPWSLFQNHKLPDQKKNLLCWLIWCKTMKKFLRNFMWVKQTSLWILKLKSINISKDFNGLREKWLPKPHNNRLIAAHFYSLTVIIKEWKFCWEVAKIILSKSQLLAVISFLNESRKDHFSMINKMIPVTVWNGINV